MTSETSQGKTDLVFELDRTHLVLFGKMLDTLKGFVPECRFDSSEESVTLTNIDDTHTVLVMGQLDRGFFSRYQYPKSTTDDGEGASDQESDSDSFLVKLDQMVKAVKSNTHTTGGLFKVNPLKIEVAVFGSSQRQRSFFNLDTYQNTDEWNDLSSDVKEKLSEYPYQIEIRSSDFKDILTALKIFKSEVVALQYQDDQLVFAHGDQRIEYALAPPVETIPFTNLPGDDLILEETTVGQTSIQQIPNKVEPTVGKIEILLGTDRLLSLMKAAPLSSYTNIYLSSEEHPVFFGFQIEDNPDNQLVIGLCARSSD